MPDIFIARQPIYKRNLDVDAYELLFRSANVEAANVVDGDAATSQVLVNALIEIGLHELVGSHHAFINCTERFLVEGLPATITPTQVVLEVLEDILPSQRLTDALARLRDSGYSIALDDFRYDASKRDLVALADVVKLDILAMPREELAREVDILRGFDIKLLAEKVETQEDYLACKELGFDYFQGYFFCKPNIVRGRHTPTSKLAIMRLLAKINDPEIEFRELEDLIAHDVSLSYRILRYINSAFFSLTEKVESIRRAITLLGLKAIKSWVTILALSNVDDKPYELMTMALMRAKMCETLAGERSKHASVAFTVGLLSTLDALMDKALIDVLGELPLTNEIKTALLSHEGPLGEILNVVLAYEQGDWETATHASKFSSAALSHAYLDSIRWSQTTNAALVSA